MQPNLANANKPIEVIPLGINWWGYKVYVAKSGLKLVDNAMVYIVLPTMTM